MPLPGSFPKAAWLDEVQRGYEFYADSGRNDLVVPRPEKVVTFFRSQAPDEIVLASVPDEASPSPVTFRPTRSAAATGSENIFVASVRWDVLVTGERPELLVCDIWTGRIQTARPNRDQMVLQPIAQLLNPPHAVPVDLDGDGRLDLVVAELGRFLPDDHFEGRVTWLRRTVDGQFEPIVLQAGLGRVADVEPADFDGDGDVDLVVAEFGWHTTGRVLLLENRAEAGGEPQFEVSVIDSRPGAIHVPVADLNGDGRPDFVALISQEHETVEVFLNEGNGRFLRHTVFNAGDPAFGSSGIQLVDLDGDGDLDVLHTSGDTFDSFYLKPNHGIRWLENRGDALFDLHELAAMPGAHRAVAGDLDGDGDLDIAACALFPRELRGGQPTDRFDGVLWLEQTTPRKFIRHGIERGNCNHAALELGDFDADGDLDIAVGGFGNATTQPELTLWWNEGPGDEPRREKR
ncbi:MAG: VCBS repeat-containing protein [Planctomycetaceae bacterium]|nr:VCBS repeat-containing protein [Planctomycetaceae bacterium]